MSRVQNNGKISAVEKASYGILGFSRSLPSQMVSLFILLFYTDVFGIPVQFTTTMLLVFSIWEGSSKQLVGFFMGKTQSRHGKYKPFLLWTIIPYALFSTAMFVAPDCPFHIEFYTLVVHTLYGSSLTTLSPSHITQFCLR